MIDGRHCPDQEPPRLIKVEGAPIDPVTDSKSGLWKAFKRALYELTRGKLGFSIGGVTVETELERERDYSEKNKAEVEKIKLENEKTVIEIAQAKEQLEENSFNRAIKGNEELRKIYDDEKTPQAVKFLQLMNLVNANPQLASQIDKIKSIATELNLKHDTAIQLLIDSKQIETADDPPEDQERE